MRRARRLLPRLVPLLVAGLLACGAARPEVPLCGDTNADGVRDASDAARISRCLADAEGCDPDRWDTNLDGRLDEVDAANVPRCDGGGLHCQCGANTIRVIVLPDPQCLTDRQSMNCIDELVRKQFGVRETRPSSEELVRRWHELRESVAFNEAADTYLDARLDVLDRTVRALTALRPPPDLVMSVGDSINQGHGACAEIRGGRRAKAERQWDRFMDNTRGRLGYQALLDASFPVVTAQGNHDECGFEQRIPGASPGKRADARTFDAKTGTGLALARHWGRIAEEEQWLAAQLAAHQTGPVFWVGHQAVAREDDEKCRWLLEREFVPHRDKIALVAGGHYLHYDKGCLEAKGGRLLLFTNFQQLEFGGQGYLVEVRIWPFPGPGSRPGDFEVRTYSPYLGESWSSASQTGPGHGLRGHLDWQRFD